MPVLGPNIALGAHARAKGGGGDAVAGFLADLTLSQRAWWSYDLAGTRYQTVNGLLAPAATEPVGLWLDRANWDERGVVNLLTHSNQIDNAAWVKTATTVSANEIDGPDGTTTADRLICSASTATHTLGQNVTVPAGSAVVGTVDLKYNDWQYATVYITDGVAKNYAVLVDIQNGTIVGNHTAFPVFSAPVASTIEALANGFYRVRIFAQLDGARTIAGTSVAFVASGSTVTSPNFLGSGQSLYVGGVQTEVGTVGTAMQITGATRGGPGNHASQSTTNFRPSLQTTGIRPDGGDDTHITGIVPGTVLTMLVKAKIGSTGAARTLIGGTVGTSRCMLAVDSAGLLAAGVGTDSIATIKGGSDISGDTGTGALVYDGSTVSLYWREVGGVLQTLYSAAQNGAPGSDPLRLFATNNSGTAGNFGNADIQHAIVAKKAAIANQIAAMTAQLNALP